MEPGGFWSLFAETGEPICWLLSRAQERLPEERAGSKKVDSQEPSEARKL